MPIGLYMSIIEKGRKNVVKFIWMYLFFLLPLQ